MSMGLRSMDAVFVLIFRGNDSNCEELILLYYILIFAIPGIYSLTNRYLELINIIAKFTDYYFLYYI